MLLHGTLKRAFEGIISQSGIHLPILSSYTCQRMMSLYIYTIRFYLIFPLGKHTAHNTSDLSQEFVTQVGGV